MVWILYATVSHHLPYLSTSLRAVFSHEDAQFNGIHGADSPNTAEQELDYFFPVEQTVAVVKPDAMQSKGTNESVQAPISLLRIASGSFVVVYLADGTYVCAALHDTA